MLNLNIGILGHVDCGKTSLAKALSQVASTAAFDKNPQSQARGITLDLGFSSFSIETPEHLKSQLPDIERIQLTLVDCPGHASLIRTIIGGAQIIDLMLLVVDVAKGVQTQTAECLVIGEITCKNLIVVFNKIDLLQEEQRGALVDKLWKKLQRALSTTCFAGAPVVTVAANPNSRRDQKPVGIDELIRQISKSAFVPYRNKEAPFLFAVDHCFGIKGKGTVMTGTVLQGSISIDDVIDLPQIKMTRKIKSMQMFKRPVSWATAGDRLGICVTQFDPKLMERGIACALGLASAVYCGILPVGKIKYFKGQVTSKSKFHITIGHETAMATVKCFSGGRSCGNFDFNSDYLWSDSLSVSDDVGIDEQEYLLLEFEKPVLAVAGCMIIGTKLDMDVHGRDCRIAFWGNLLASYNDKEYKSCFLPTLKIFKNKSKMGTVERLISNNTVIVKNLFKKESNLEVFVGFQVSLSTGEVGVIESSFGQSGKVKVFIKDSLSESTINIVNSKSKNNKSCNEMGSKPVTCTLSFKRYIYDDNKTVVQ